MIPAVTGISILNSNTLDGKIPAFGGPDKKGRIHNALDGLMVASVGNVLLSAGIPVPVANDDIYLYIGIDISIEDIKNEYFNNILDEGILGASPQLFQFTTPNSLAAQATIAFDLRGECITMPIGSSFREIVEYACECIIGQNIKMAIAGCIRKVKALNLHTSCPVYSSEFFFIEDRESAIQREVKIYPNALDSVL